MSVLADSKAYRNWSVGRPDRALLYHEPPTLEREDQEVPANDNALGGRLRTEVRVGAGLTTWVNLLAYRFSDSGESAIDGSTAAHGYVGADKIFDDGGSLGLQTGLRDENRPDGSDRRSHWHVDFDAALPVTKRLAATFKLNHRSERKQLLEELRFVRGLAVAGLAIPGLVTVSGLYGYSTEEVTSPTHYPGAELLVHVSRGGLFASSGGDRLAGACACPELAVTFRHFRELAWTCC